MTHVQNLDTNIPFRTALVDRSKPTPGLPKLATTIRYAQRDAVRLSEAQRRQRFGQRRAA